LFVHSFDRKSIDGILAAADLTRSFGAFVRPLTMMEEIENRLRRAADGAFAVQEIRSSTRTAFGPSEITRDGHCLKTGPQLRGAGLITRSGTSFLPAGLRLSVRNP
jgi:hypothetical protein